LVPLGLRNESRFRDLCKTTRVGRGVRGPKGRRIENGSTYPQMALYIGGGPQTKIIESELGAGMCSLSIASVT